MVGGCVLRGGVLLRRCVLGGGVVCSVVVCLEGVGLHSIVEVPEDDSGEEGSEESKRMSGGEREV